MFPLSVAASDIPWMAVIALVLGVLLVAVGGLVDQANPMVGRIGEYLIVTGVAWGTIKQKEQGKD